MMGNFRNSIDRLRLRLANLVGPAGRRRFVAVTLVLASGPGASQASGIYGTMSNFDVFNDTSTDAYGAELELEGIHSSDLSTTFPSHFNHKSIEDYSDGASFGTRIRFSGYNFNADGFLSPTVGQSTNGHFCVNVPGCEHFGFSVSAQPAATRYFWLDQSLQRIGSTPMAVPTPTWSYVPPARPGDAPVVRAEVEMPEPAEIHAQRPDSIWMKVYKTEIERPVRLDELMSNGGVSPEDESETESEWELLEGGKNKQAEDEVRDDNKSVIRRYEYFKYTGLYDEEHEPLSAFLDDEMDEPPAGELGAFIAANMVAVNLVAPLLPGDFDQDDTLSLMDLELLASALHAGNANLAFDLNGDDQVSTEDQRVWVEDLKRTWFGDATLDGEFNSADLIQVFQAGEYEDGALLNSTWSTGDWNADAEFDSGDLVTAFQTGGYEQGPRAALAAAVPEPHGYAFSALLTLGLAAIRRRVGR